MGKARQAISGRGRVSLPRGGAARFAAEVLLRHSGREEADWYPEAWLALREERKWEQAGGRRLNQLTLRLLLQINEYLTAPGEARPSRMEYHLVLGALAASLRPLETRGGIPAEEIRLLVGRLSALEKAGPSAPGREESVRRAREEIARWLARADLPAPPLPSASAGPISRTSRREGGKSGWKPGAGPAVPPSLGAAAPDLRFSAFPAPESGGSLRREWLDRPVLFQAAAAPRRQAFRLSGFENQGAPARLPAASSFSRRLVREKLTALLIGGDEGERKEIRRVLEEQRWLIDRHPEVFQREAGPLESRLADLVQRCADAELFRLSRVLEQALTQRPPARERAALVSPPPSGGEARPDRGRGARLEQASPALEWLSRALERGRVRREDLLRLLAKAQPAARLAFLTLAEESGAFSKPPRSKAGDRTRIGWSGAQDPERRLTLLVRECSRRQLEQLLQWTREEDRRTRAAQTDARGMRPADGGRDARRTEGSRGELQTPDVRERRSRLLRELRTLLPAASAEAGKAPEPPVSPLEGTSRPRQGVLRLPEKRRITDMSRRNAPDGSRAAAQSPAAGAPSAHRERSPSSAVWRAAGQNGPRPTLRGYPARRWDRSPGGTCAMPPHFFLPSTQGWGAGMAFLTQAPREIPTTTTSQIHPGKTGLIRTGPTPDVPEGAAKPQAPWASPPDSRGPGLWTPALAAPVLRSVRRLPGGALGRETPRPPRPAAPDANRPYALRDTAPAGKPPVHASVPPALRTPFFPEGVQAGPARRQPLLSERILRNSEAPGRGTPRFSGWKAGWERDVSLRLPAAWRGESRKKGPPPAAFPLRMARPAWDAVPAWEAGRARGAGSLPEEQRAPAPAERPPGGPGGRGMALAPGSGRRGEPPALEKARGTPALRGHAPLAVRRQAPPVRLPLPGGEQAPPGGAGAARERTLPPAWRRAAALTGRETGALPYGAVRPPAAAPLPQAARKASPPESGRGVPAASRPEAELALLRSPASGPRQAAAQAAEETALRQTPELKLLRRQAGEQAERITRQQESMSGLREQIQRQEQLLRQALTQRAPAEEAGQVRRLTRAVMAEMEKQLRLERQRRGLS